MSVEMMALLLQEQMKEMRAHLARKMADTGGQSSPEIVRWVKGLWGGWCWWFVADSSNSR